jgi:DNA-binding Lrp family transcriptional regulator
MMEKEGIITGATTQINFDTLNYDALVNLLISVEAQQVEQVMEYIKKITEIRAYRQYNNIYNIRAFAILKNLNELDLIKSAIRRILPTASLKTYIWTAVKNIPENLQVKPNSKDNKQIIKQTCTPILNQTKRIKIDELDKQIIEKLTINGRTPFCKIAKDIGTSTDTVLKRYQKLKKNGVIKITIQIDPNKIGYHSILDFNIAFASPINSSSFIEQLAKIPDITTITKTSGDYDLQLIALIRDIEQMFGLQEEISRITGVTKIETSARKILKKWPTPQQQISTF